jgi:hypothetical protein
MLTRLIDALRGRPTGGPPEARAESGGGAVARAAGHAPLALPPLPPESTLPHPSAMADLWRQQLARTTIALRERYPAGDDPHARAARGHAERLLVKVAVDLDMVVRQPPPAAQEALAVAGDPQCELPALVRVLERDPAVTRGLMRHASSVMFAASGPPASLDDAVRRLGARGVQVAVLSGWPRGCCTTAARTCRTPSSCGRTWCAWARSPAASPAASTCRRTRPSC